MIFEIYKNSKLIGEFFFTDLIKATEYMQILKESSYSAWVAKRVKWNWNIYKYMMKMVFKVKVCYIIGMKI